MISNAYLDCKAPERVLKTTGWETDIGSYIDKNQAKNARAREKIRLDPLSVAPVMVTTKALGLLQFELHYRLASQRCLPAKCIRDALLSHLVYIIVSHTPSRPQKVQKYKAIGYLNNYINTITNNES